MTNDQLAEPLYLAARLLELSGENPFKARAYEKAGDAVSAANDYLADRIAAGRAEALEGVGETTRQALASIVATGSFAALDELKRSIPAGVVELSRIRGLGAKKLQTVWRELGLDSPEALLSAVADGRLAATKGFGKKSADAIAAAAEYYVENRSRLRLDQAIERADRVKAALRQLPGVTAVEDTGELRRALPTLEAVELLVITPASAQQLAQALAGSGLELSAIVATADEVSARFADGKGLQLYTASPADAGTRLFVTTGGALTDELLAGLSLPALPTEEAVFAHLGLPHIAPELRDTPEFLPQAHAGALPQLLTEADLRGAVHCHSTWSDGLNTLREMALAARARGWHYLVISDHSRTAAYAGGLSLERVAAQHAEIDALNAELAPFRIFKGIESDILPDGSLDYPDAVLATFDVVIASVHAGLKMDAATATARVLRAVENPYTTLLGHPTGRLLLDREGYPLDHEAILEACARCGVAVEINADPHRLDLDWRWVRPALELGIPISINPDAHLTGAYDYVRYGVLQGRKGGLTLAQTLNARSADAFADYLAQRRRARRLP